MAKEDMESKSYKNKIPTSMREIPASMEEWAAQLKELRELKKLKETQVLDIEVLKKGSRINVGALFLKVGEVLLEKSESDVAMMKLGNGEMDSIAVVVKGNKNCKELLKRLRGMVS